MKIIKLESENVKRLRAIRIEPDGALVVIGGRNAQGKTSVLDSIQMALGGKDSIPAEPIRKGEKRALVVVDLGDLIVKRIFTEKDSRLEITDKDGSSLRSPQSLLDALTGRLSFDPLEFSRMEAKKQAATLKGLVGLDFTEFDREREKAYNERTRINREIKSLDARIIAIPFHEGVPGKEVSISDLTLELQKRMDINRGNAQKRTDYEKAKELVESLKIQLEDLLKDLEEKTVLLINLENEINNLSDHDIDSINAGIGAAEKNNEKVRSNHRRAELAQELTTKISQAKVLDEKIDEIDNDKAELLALTEFPVEGLGFDENGVTYKGLPFEQGSSSEQLRVSVAIGLAMNPKLKILLIRDGSLLDEDNLRLIAEMAEKAGAQIWLEKVGGGKEVSVIIEDGSIKN